ncbi:Kelch repeat and BTB domain-containing protein 7 [Madurella fahalii]|uniref:Kelch repeat and BTB domain-containing protein 7 n=1 Tax=Madurella fahalii TaxID=1157608 RepID=A0ABQ0FZG8_9PEZI
MASYSYADDLGTDTVTLLVGPDHQKFVVHKNLLVSQSSFFRGALATNLFREAVEGVMTLETDDPDAFRLLVGWLYRGHIPRVQLYITKPDFSIQDTAQPSSTAGRVTPPLSIKESVNVRFTLENRDFEGSQAIAGHLSFHPTYKSFSPEEIRLADYEAVAAAEPPRRDIAITPKVRRDWLNGKPGTPMTGEAVSAVNTPSTETADREAVKSNEQQASERPSFTFRMKRSPQRHSDSEGSDLDESDEEQEQVVDYEGWTFPVGFEPAAVATASWLNWKAQPGYLLFTSHEQASKEADSHQFRLVKLIALAEKLCWDKLFNAAMDAYLDGERLMRRTFVPLAHLQVAYTKCCETSPFRRLLFDMVHYEATIYKTHWRYLELSLTCGDFVADLLRRLDHEAWVPGKPPYDKLADPLENRSCIYHRHEEWTGTACF